MRSPHALGTVGCPREQEQCLAPLCQLPVQVPITFVKGNFTPRPWEGDGQNRAPRSSQYALPYVSRVPSSPITLSPSLLTASCYSEESKVVQRIFFLYLWEESGSLLLPPFNPTLSKPKDGTINRNPSFMSTP